MNVPTGVTRRIVLCSLEDWDEVWRRNQYLVDALLARDPALQVLFVEPPADPVHELRRGKRAKLGRGLVPVDGYRGRLTRFQPTKLLPRALGTASDAGLTRSVRVAVKKLGWTDPQLWINDPKWAPVRAATGWRALYDITDDWPAAVRGAREHALLVRSDRQLLDCDEVVVCSPTLLTQKSPEVRGQITLVRNAVDVVRYREPCPRPADLPSGPFAVYVGTLHEDRLDLDLVVSTSERLAALGATLVLVGPNVLSAENGARLAAAPGAVVLGSRARDTIPGYLQHAHSLVVPHIVDDFTESLDPLKLYEYLAVGRPIVSTAVAGFREAAAEGILIAAGAEFVDGVAATVVQWTPDVVHDGVPDWATRAEEMRVVLDRLELGHEASA